MATTRNPEPCPICEEPYALSDDGEPYHLACNLEDEDHEVCDPDDGHIPTTREPTIHEVVDQLAAKGMSF